MNHDGSLKGVRAFACSFVLEIEPDGQLEVELKGKKRGEGEERGTGEGVGGED